MEYKTCTGCQEHLPLTSFPVVWGIQHSDFDMYVGQGCVKCHDWYNEQILREVNRNIDIIDRQKKNE